MRESNSSRVSGFFVAVVLTGCVSVPTGIVMHPEGRQPTRQEAQVAILSHLKRVLLDPESLKAFAVLRGPEVVTGTTAGLNYERAWQVCVEYNAKNAYGGYTGLTTHSYALRFSDDDLIVVSTINWIAQDKKC
ncbi:hypothetical protein [Cognatazoarcus halotolerans]|uniref:hypothetical protein n=1 Tax=Cognatazoarcus halotolerans TaxID=2686016 RepID=UPI001356CBC8|nr:hypothetical protein [Cognatazoarcus halotolerans]MCB1901495.1 hypothetical protein [Rhodocyclaceae bacterium]MCP5308140.1 hypothetical protein [Zoogloeaceae bacterium]